MDTAEARAIQDRLRAVRAEIDAACAAAGRPAADVHLVAVSKGHPAAALRAAYEAGQRDFGESYVGEFLEKREALTDLSELRWHFIGHLQRNKMRKVVGQADLIHAIADARGLQALDAAAARAGLRQPCLLQVNVGADPAKFGCAPEDLDPLLDVARACTHVEVRGLMTIPPLDIEPSPLFAALAALAPQIGPQSVLSMGMSDDFPAAIAAGATHVRVGTAIFGARRAAAARG